MAAFDRWAPLLGLIFFILLGLQLRAPLRGQKYRALPRLVRNLVFALPAFLTLRIALIPIPLATAWWAQSTSMGLLNWLPLPQAIEVLCGMVWMDYAYYWWHVATHRVPLLWRFHNVHHADLDMDVSTATRFHFGELLLSIGFRVLAVVVVGVSPVALLAFEIVFETAGQFHHSNWRLPIGVESILSRVIITPRLHGIHHHQSRELTDSNWGTIFSLWDSLHHTSRCDVAQEQITIGSPDHHGPREMTLGEMWTQPFRGSSKGGGN